MAATRIKIIDNGPYLVKGEIEITDSQGNTITPPSQSTLLCRCGASTDKPYCDGTHSKVGFEASRNKRSPTG